jgi:hypothetical protein
VGKMTDTEDMVAQIEVKKPRKSRKWPEGLKKTLAATRFWLRVDQSMGPEKCWLWKGPIRKTGYGICYNGLQAVQPHRFSWEIANHQPAPTGKVVMHSCDVRNCVNPSHLSIGTIQDNNFDMRRKGRDRHKGNPGETNSQAVLTREKVIQIYTLANSKHGRRCAPKIAKRFGISRQHVTAIKNIKVWHWLLEPIRSARSAGGSDD